MNTIGVIDPKLFLPEMIDAETSKFNSKLETVLAKMVPIYKKTPQEARAEADSGDNIWGPFKRSEKAVDRVLECKTHDVPVRIVIPEEVNGVYLHIHGGGFIMMHPYHFDPSLVETAERCKLAMVSVDYRLAPENPYPAAADDCENVAVWLAENAEAEFGSKNIFIGGESAGANLAVVTLNRMRDRHDFKDFIGTNLVFGCFDISMTPSQRNCGNNHLILSTPTIEWFNSLYVPDHKMRRDPDVSPLYADLSNLPPAIFTIGTLDPLLDDTLFMYSRWLAAGNSAELAVYPGGTHAFDIFPIKIARDANERIYNFINGLFEKVS